MTAPTFPPRTSSYHAIALWSDGQPLNLEHKPDRETAFDTAADALTKMGCERVQVLRVHRSVLTGRVLGVSDVTDALYAERKLEELVA